MTKLEEPAAPGLSTAMTLLLATAAGVSVANLYLAQPLTGLIGPAIGLPPSAFGLIVTLTQLGYVMGLILLVPLGDCVENRRLTVSTLGTGTAVLLLTSFVRGPAVFLLASFAIGVTSVTTQMVIPLAAHLARPERQGRQVATVVSGLLTGILLSRPLASMIASVAGWRAVYAVAAVLMAAMAVALWRLLPPRHPGARQRYGQIIRSIGPLIAGLSPLRRRTAYHMALFLAFSMFWTAIPLELSGPRFGLGQGGIAIFSLLGAAGALSAPLAGRLADAGKVVSGTAVCMAAVAAGMLLTWGGDRAGHHGGLALLVAGVIMIDAGVQGHIVFAQRVLFGLAPENRSRLNAVFIAGTFLSGAAGSALAPLVLSHAGWVVVAIVGALAPLGALAFFLTRDWANDRALVQT